ncbi:hypothetical protein I4U23_016510 [Adineta vaga]|nr:hypothetical protein I4U23_016510 [Adineta vaga]
MQYQADEIELAPMNHNGQKNNDSPTKNAVINDGKNNMCSVPNTFNTALDNNGETLLLHNNQCNEISCSSIYHIYSYGNDHWHSDCLL